MPELSFSYLQLELCFTSQQLDRNYEELGCNPDGSSLPDSAQAAIAAVNIAILMRMCVV